jgi:hypothetical protein
VIIISMKKHLTWFPFLVIAMTFILAVTIVVYDRQKNRPPPIIHIDDVLIVKEDSSIDNNQYYEDVRNILSPIWGIVDGQSDEISVIVIARNKLIDMRVPSNERDTHVQLVAALNILEAGLRGEEDSFADAQIRFSDIKNNVVWIQ